MAARTLSVSSFHCWFCAAASCSFFDPVRLSKCSRVDESVEITSFVAFTRRRGSKICAKAVAVMGLGNEVVREMGRWREKKSDALISTTQSSTTNSIALVVLTSDVDLRVGEMCCVLGTLGR